MEVDKSLLDKYNVPVPRYTSYPPANHFNDFLEDDCQKFLVESNTKEPQHVAFYIHIPFCKQICHYCGCNAVGFTSAQKVEEYVNALLTEIDLVTSKIDLNRKVSQIHYGGGTPNAIDSGHLKRINEALLGKFQTIEKPEIAIECNPALLDFKYLNELFEAGFNRFSFGIQDFDKDVLKLVNRKPSEIPVQQLVEYVKKSNPDYAVNLDFMYGLPGQTVNTFKANMKRAAEIKPDRLVTFSYAHVPWFKKHQQILEKFGLPSPNEKMKMFLAGYEVLKEAGYVDIGLDHYALPNDELSIALKNGELGRNFQGYCTKRTTGQVYAFGASAISQLASGFVQNVKGIKEYISLLEAGSLPVEKGYELSKNETLVKETISQLMCNRQINWQDLADALQVEPYTLKTVVGYSEKILEHFKEDGLLEFDSSYLKLTDRGGLFIRNIAASFDPAYNAKLHKYSKSV